MQDSYLLYVAGLNGDHAWNHEFGIDKINPCGFRCWKLAMMVSLFPWPILGTSPLKVVCLKIANGLPFKLALFIFLLRICQHLLIVPPCVLGISNAHFFHRNNCSQQFFWNAYNSTNHTSPRKTSSFGHPPKISTKKFRACKLVEPPPVLDHVQRTHGFSISLAIIWLALALHLLPIGVSVYVFYIHTHVYVM